MQKEFFWGGQSDYGWDRKISNWFLFWIRIFVGETYIVNGETFSEFICVKKSELLDLLNDF